MSQRAHRQGEREGDVVVGLSRERLDPSGRVGVGRLDDAGRVEPTEHAAQAEREAAVARIVGLERLDHDDPSNRSLSSVTSAAGGAQSKTPATWPSTTGVSGPHIPRRKR